jgi:hypothetical protein
MVTTLAISKYVNSLLEVETKFLAQQSISDRFFCEWYEDLPELTEVEKECCNLLKERYLYHRHHGHISEGLVNQIAIAPFFNDFSLYNRRTNELLSVLQILKKISQLFQ